MDTFAKHINRRHIFKDLPNQMLVPKSDWDNYYNHYTIRVSSLSEFIEVISKLTQKSKDTEYHRLVYRGHSDSSSNYRLIPSLARYDSALERSENIIVDELITLRPEEFQNIPSDFDLIAKMQHYELPTRLLDFSYNPLIALYFACCDGKSSGRVLCTYDTSSLHSSQIVEKICGMYHYDDYSALSLDRLLGDVSLLRRYALYTRTPLMMKPKYSNDRIKHQSAVFMVFPNIVYDRRSRMVELSRKNKTEQEQYRIGFEMNDLEQQRLPYIREEHEIYTDDFEVTSNTLSKLFKHYCTKFDDFDLIGDFGINPKYHFLFKNRFSLTNDIQELSPETISSSFVSILIDAKQKKTIMQELESVGIDKSFVFPELTYTTEKIKNKYILEK